MVLHLQHGESLLLVDGQATLDELFQVLRQFDGRKFLFDFFGTGLPELLVDPQQRWVGGVEVVGVFVGEGVDLLPFDQG